ncbi:MAG: hypothetical protein D6758_00605 [Gammaproteobacteria bacterium]|nr:MAG: hypothetical protein D6758_00605 [Gammaproteobacteria bacterium]
MSDRIKESLSALMDDEATELEIRRVLMHDDQNEVQATWCRYQQVRALMRDEEHDWSTVDLLEGINAGLDGEANDAERTGPVASPAQPAAPDNMPGKTVDGPPASRYRWPLGAAVAALLVAAVWVIRPDAGSAPVDQVASVGGPPPSALETHLMKHLQYAAMNTGQLVAYARLNAFDIQGE